MADPFVSRSEIKRLQATGRADLIQAELERLRLRVAELEAANAELRAELDDRENEARDW